MTALALRKTDSITLLDDSQPLPALGPLERAYQLSLPALEAIPARDLLVVNFDVPTAFTIALGAAQRLAVFRERLAALPEFDITQFDALEQYAQASMHAHIEYEVARKGPADVDALLVAVRKWCRVLKTDAQGLILRNLLAPHVLQGLDRRRGYVYVASNLFVLVAILRKVWHSIAGKTGLTEVDLREAEYLSEELMSALALRKQPLKDLKKLALQRQRAFTLFSLAYSQVRRALQFLCHGSDDAESLLPTLYRRRSRRARSKAKPVTNGSTSDVASQPVVRTTEQPQENENHLSIVPSVVAPTLVRTEGERVANVAATVQSSICPEPCEVSAPKRKAARRKKARRRALPRAAGNHRRSA